MWERGVGVAAPAVGGRRPCRRMNPDRPGFAGMAQHPDDPLGSLARLGERAGLDAESLLAPVRPELLVARASELPRRAGGCGLCPRRRRARSRPSRRRSSPPPRSAAPPGRLPARARSPAPAPRASRRRRHLYGEVVTFFLNSSSGILDFILAPQFRYFR